MKKVEVYVGVNMFSETEDCTQFCEVVKEYDNGTKDVVLKDLEFNGGNSVQNVKPYDRFEREVYIINN